MPDWWTWKWSSLKYEKSLSPKVEHTSSYIVCIHLHTSTYMILRLCNLHPKSRFFAIIHHHTLTYIACIHHHTSTYITSSVNRPMHCWVWPLDVANVCWCMAMYVVNWDSQISGIECYMRIHIHQHTSWSRGSSCLFYTSSYINIHHIHAQHIHHHTLCSWALHTSTYITFLMTTISKCIHQHTSTYIKGGAG